MTRPEPYEDQEWPQVGAPFLRVTRWRDPPLAIVAVRRTVDGFEVEMKETAWLRIRWARR